MNISTEAAQRQLAKAEPVGECLLLLNDLDKDGYCGVREQRDKVRRREKAHRAAYELAHGPIPDGMLVLHHCDNRPCVNPDHLHLGTHEENAAEKVGRGRSRNMHTYYTLGPVAQPYETVLPA